MKHRWYAFVIGSEGVCAPLLFFQAQYDVRNFMHVQSILRPMSHFRDLGCAEYHTTCEHKVLQVNSSLLPAGICDVGSLVRFTLGLYGHIAVLAA